MSTIPLIRLPAELAKRTGHHTTYGRCHRLILDGRLSATKVGREWHIATEDLPLAEQMLGLTSENSSLTN